MEGGSEGKNAPYGGVRGCKAYDAMKLRIVEEI